MSWCPWSRLREDVMRLKLLLGFALLLVVLATALQGYANDQESEEETEPSASGTEATENGLWLGDLEVMPEKIGPWRVRAGWREAVHRDTFFLVWFRKNQRKPYDLVTVRLDGPEAWRAELKI